jgi:hypothetical protein
LTARGARWLVNGDEIVAHRSFLIPNDSEVLLAGNVPAPDRMSADNPAAEKKSEFHHSHQPLLNRPQTEIGGVRLTLLSKSCAVTYTNGDTQSRTFHELLVAIAENDDV